jgi:single-stranded-DNA-specific exonuclease
VAESINAYTAEPYDYAEARALADELGLSEPVAITLVRRGYRTPEEAREFLAADESHPPEAFRSMAGVVELISTAIDQGAQITVHGDFDVDGVCATTIMVSALRELGAECDWLIPDRMADGYGLSAENVQKLAERGTELLITVDCGIASVDEVALAKELGMDVVVTDHHQPGAELPDCPILHPAVDEYPFEQLCGTAVAWKLSCALGQGSADLDLVALATVADVVPLVGENRSLVRKGLAEVRRARRPGIRALLEAAKCEPTQVDEGDLAFRLAPRINAAGRLYRADAGVELFLTEDADRAAEIAQELGRANSERRATEREVDTAAEAARRELPDELREAPGLVLAGEGWHPGVIGIVASRLAERHHRPVVVISLDGEGGGRGSGRSIPGFDLLAALEACGEHLDGFGGHRAAAGLQLQAANVESFQAAFAAHAASVLEPEDMRRTERIDAMVGGAGLGLDLAEELQQLAPFGMGNPGVRLLVPAARVRDVRTMGEGKHARFSLHSGAHRALGVAFGRTGLGVGEDDPVDAAVRLEVNRWNGSVEPRLVLRELYPREIAERAAAAAAAETAEWWRRFEAEHATDPEGWSSFSPDSEQNLDHPPSGRIVVRPRSSPAAVVGELASCGGGEVLAVVACAERRAALAGEGVVLADAERLAAEPGLAGRFEHVVFVDPPQFEQVERLALAGEGYAHLAWGEAEHRFAVAMLAEQLARRETLIGLFRDLREAGEASGAELLAALRGSGRFPRAPETAARCLRVLSELELVRGAPESGDGGLGVVSSGGTELERSAAYRAYGARHQEGLRYLERRNKP